MRVLILGGTVFLGKHIVHAALAGGHDVTLFNRGKSRPGAFPNIETIHGDRTNGLGELAGRKWDAVIDTCGYVPRVVGMSADALKESTGLYVFISSVSVYRLGEKPDVTEEDPVAVLEDPTAEEITSETYGGLKARCEARVIESFGDRALIVRPGLIVGPDDPSDRFTYWPCRMARGGEAVVPDRQDQPVQIIDVRDLATWTVSMISGRTKGTFNATGPEQPCLLGRLLEEIRDVVRPETSLVWASPTLLEAQSIGPWKDLPLYLGSSVEGDAMMRADVSRALSNGLAFRPLNETVSDTLKWANSRPADTVWKAGLTPEREVEFLTLLKAE